MTWYIGITFIGGLASLGVFLLFLARGHFDDIEDVKYQMFRDD